MLDLIVTAPGRGSLVADMALKQSELINAELGKYINVLITAAERLGLESEEILAQVKNTIASRYKYRVRGACELAVHFFTY